MKMKWYVIPVDGAAYFHEFESEDGVLKELQSLVGGLVECIGIDHEADLWVNEEGLLTGMLFNETATYILQALGMEEAFIVGPAVLAGWDKETGDTVGLSEVWLEVLS